MNKTQFIEFLKEKNIILNEEMLTKFDNYFVELVNQNKLHNLTSITDEEGVYEKHFYDSLSVCFDFSLENLDVIDVGSGGGFPGMPLKIANPSMNLYILDSTEKKVRFLKELANKLELKNIEGIVSRAEEYKEKKFDVVTARGVASLRILLELCVNLVKENGYFVAMKGAKYLEELEEAKNAIKTLGYELVKKVEYTLPSENATRCNLYFKKIKKHDSKYPRNYGTLKKKPL